MKRAYTLIELVATLSILGILAAILFPVFAQARERARATACLSNMKQIGTATTMYVQDYDETYPCGWGQPDSGQTMWRMALQPYIQKYGDQAKLAKNLYDSSAISNMGVYSCPDQPANQNYGPTSYGYNAHGGMTTGWSNAQQTFPGASLASIDRPANMVAFADAGEVGGPSKPLDPNFDEPTNCNISAGTGNCGPYKFEPKLWKERWSVDWDFGVPGTEDWPSNRNGGRRPMPRHFGKFNAVFADGHAKSVNGEVMKVRQGSDADILHNTRAPNP